MLLDNICVQRALIDAVKALNEIMLPDFIAKEVNFVLLKLFYDFGAFSQFDLIYNLDAHEPPSLYILCNFVLAMAILTFAERQLNIINHLI